MSSHTYKPELVKCFNLSFGTSHDKHYNFSNEELFHLTPDHIYAYLAYKAFGTTQPSDTDKPTKGRSNSIEYAKKAISYFMPNKMMKWDLQNNSGNPTKSVIVNELIKRIKKAEVRREGKASAARRPMELTEFAEVIKRCRTMPSDNIGRHTGAAYFLFQFHMMARLDDVENFKCEDIMVNLEHPFTLKSKMRWSKNVLEERKSPDQIIIGSMDPNFCVLLGLALHLEHASLTINQNSSPLLFSVPKRSIQDLLGEITSQEDFLIFNRNSPIGTHSIRKLPATYARRNGCSKDDVDARGRWKSNKRIVDTYIDCLIPFPDAKVASTLCIGGPVKYVVREEFASTITENLIFELVGVNISNLFPRQVALVLGKVIIWAAYDDAICELMDPNIVARIKSFIPATESIIEGTALNPVTKVALVVAGNEGNLLIEELVQENNNNANSTRISGSYDQTSVMITQVWFLVKVFYFNFFTDISFQYFLDQRVAASK